MPAAHPAFHLPVHALWIWLSLCLGGLAPGLAIAQTDNGALAQLQALSQASAAVVGIEVTATGGASSARTLGKRRTGSGVVIGADGLVLTIGYLILEAENIQIITSDRKALPAVAVAYDLATGLALVRPLLPLPEVTPATLRANAPLIRPGEPLMVAVGATRQGNDSDVSMTQLISQRAFSGTWEYHLDSALFTSPLVSAGSGNHSGAPVFNQQGELLGIGSLRMANASGDSRQLPGNMFVPTALLPPILAELQQSGSSRPSQRPWLGVTSTDADGQVQILRVSDNSPAHIAGLQAGDVVLAVDEAPVTTLEAFYKKLWARPTPDTPVRLTVRQGTSVRTLELQPKDRLLTLARPAGI